MTTDAEFDFDLFPTPPVAPVAQHSECDRTQAGFAFEVWKRDQGIVPNDPLAAALRNVRKRSRRP